MTVNTRGMDAIRRGLPDTIERGVVRGAELIADVERQLVPVKRGWLRDSIRVEPGETPTSRKVIAGDARADYAAHVNYGTVNSPAQPFAEPSVQAIDVEAEIADEVRRLVAGAR